MVRLLTHNILACHVKGCNTNNFPLEFKDVLLEVREVEFNPEFLKGFMPKLEWKALVETAIQVGVPPGLKIRILKGGVASWAIHLCH